MGSTLAQTDFVSRSSSIQPNMTQLNTDLLEDPLKPDLTLEDFIDHSIKQSKKKNPMPVTIKNFNPQISRRHRNIRKPKVHKTQKSPGPQELSIMKSSSIHTCTKKDPLD